MKKLKSFRYKGLVVIWGMFLVIGLILLAERSGIRYQRIERRVDYIEKEQCVTTEEAEQSLGTVCLAIMDSRNASSAKAKPQFEQIFQDMKIGYQMVDVATEEIPDFAEYETVVVLLTDISPLQETVLELTEWVYEGGNVLFALTLEKESYLSMIEQKLGIISSGYESAVVEHIYLDESFMIGGGRSYTITEPYESAWVVDLSEQARVYAWTDDERRVPLVWSNEYGEGRFVVDNFGIYEKVLRGFYAASYSLLMDVCAYPVINGSTYYLDDFPSPVPSGDGTYVKRDYQTSIADFYANIWWPDMLELAEKHNIRFTGVVIENYGDETDGNVEMQEDATQFQYFGNMLLRQGGEIGYHGYNHQPLSLENVDYEGILPYDTWDSCEAMQNSVTELIRFVDEMYPSVEKSVYVPPSNVLSAEGRQMLGRDFSQICTIASTYFPGECAYEQEFEVAQDGIVEQPRVISGCMIDEYMELAAVSELNMHFVNNHFMHPDDLLDEDRGAALGWEALRNRLDEYMSWVDESAPCIRNLTGSELSGAIQRYAALTVEKQIHGQTVCFRLGNLYDEAYLMVRINEGTPRSVIGGELEHITGNLYLLCARESEVRIELDD